MTKYPKVELTLPDWIYEEITEEFYSSNDEKMDLVIRLSERNIFENTGGPFGAGIFEKSSGRLVAPGVNIVVPQSCSVAHAETMAIMIAQNACGTFDLGASSLPDMELVTSAQPCIQCFGNIWWSGLKSVVVGATCKDVEELTGFEEGPVPYNWVELFQHRENLETIVVTQGIQQNKARRVLQTYNGLVYNAGADRDQIVI
jgi:tRNA(Arg) A34 adenosine deaminase TadA